MSSMTSYAVINLCNWPCSTTSCNFIHSTSCDTVKYLYKQHGLSITRTSANADGTMLAHLSVEINNTCNRLRLDVVDSSRPISLRHRTSVVVVGHRGGTQSYGGTASERQSCSLVEITRFEPTPPYLYLAPPLGVISLELRWDFWHRKTRVSGLSFGVVNVILGLAIFVQPDGQTNRHTRWQLILC